MYQRSSCRLPSDLTDFLSEESSSLYSGSTASTRERLLQGRWRQGSLDGSQEQREFSDTSSVSTLRNSEPDTFRSYSSTSSLLSPARRYRGQPRRPTSPGTQEQFSLLEYKSLSAQDFRKKILREERLALDKDDVSSTVDSQDMDRGSLRSARFSPTVTILNPENFSLDLKFTLCRPRSPVSVHLITILLL